jgi:predicted patatin/cPLA2 family phospholipase
MDDPVVQLLVQRAAANSRPPHADGARLGLCIEGGSMRGVVSAGMVVALEQLGLAHCFDVVYGSSAGAMNGAYFLAGQAALGTTMYYHDLNNATFIDFRRPLRGRPILDLDFLVDEVMVHRKPLDTSAILDSPVPLVAVATDAATGERHLFRDFVDGADLRHAMRAGASMPIFAGPPYRHRQGTYFDALLTEPIPVPVAEAEGCTHVLALLTRPHEPGGRTIPFWERHIVGRRMSAMSEELGRRYRERGATYTALVAQLDAGTGPAGIARVSVIRPQAPVVAKLERRRERLVAGATAGLRAVFAAIARTDVRGVETLSAYDALGRRAASLASSAWIADRT